ncbi:MAG: type 3 dihydrofolate reductase [Kangiellaceae bacterium]|nr:type 3 dihydrofolate reductase [Kangiellaceae bacterium]|tara:strand:- start:14572 stop:15069 length:498 start_codon:yes stop_codon:yes gene_type:complete
MIVSMIAAMARNRVIGKDNKMPWHLPADLQFFKRSTMGKPIVMGRKTYESIGKALPGRMNIVISRDREFEADGICVLHDMEEALGFAANHAEGGEIMIIGGGHLYQQCLPIANRLYITEINAAVEGDTHFPDYMQYAWQQTFEEKHGADDKNPYPYCFRILERME